MIMLCACSTVIIDKKPDNGPKGCDIGGDKCDSDVIDYDEFMAQDNVFKEITMDDAITIFENKQSAVIYFGFPSCPWCLEALPILNEVAKSKDIEILYVMTRDKERNLLYSDDQKATILKYIGEYEDRDKEGNLSIYVPLVIVCENGEAVKGHLGTVESHDAHERVMDEKEKSELKEIYLEMFK